MSLTTREFDFEACLLPGKVGTARLKDAVAKRTAIRARAAAEKVAASEQFTRSRMKGRSVKEMMLDVFESKHHGGSGVVLQRFFRKYHTNSRASLDEFLRVLGLVGMDSFPRSDLLELYDTYKQSPEDDSIVFDRFVDDLVSMLRGRSTLENTLELSTSLSALSAQQRTLRSVAGVERSRDSSDVTEEEAELLLLEKLDQRLPRGALALERAFRKMASVSEENLHTQVPYDQFCVVLHRLGLEGLPDRVWKGLYARFVGEYPEKFTYSEFEQRLARDYTATRQGVHAGLAQQMQLARRVHHAAAVDHSDQEQHINLHALLLEKVDQRIHGEHQLRRCFRRTEYESDWSKLSFPEFRQGLRALGLESIPDVTALAYFKTYDVDTSGCLEFRKLARALMPGLPRIPKVQQVATDTNDADENEHRHCRHRKHRHRRGQHSHRHSQKHRSESSKGGTSSSRSLRNSSVDLKYFSANNASSPYGGNNRPFHNEAGNCRSSEIHSNSDILLSKSQSHKIPSSRVSSTDCPSKTTQRLSTAPRLMAHCESAPALMPCAKDDLRFMNIPQPRVTKHRSR